MYLKSIYAGFCSKLRLRSKHSHHSAPLGIYDKLHIVVKAQLSARSTWPWSLTRLGIWPQDMASSTNTVLAPVHGLSAASRHKLAFTSRHYSLLTAIDTTALDTKLPFLLLFVYVDLSLSSKFQPPHEGTTS